METYPGSEKAFKKGLSSVLGNGENINFGVLMARWVPINKITPNMEQPFNHQARVFYFILPIKELNIDNLKGIIPTYLINKINHFSFLSQY